MNVLFDLVDGTLKLFRMILRPFWRFSRGAVTTLLPGQPRGVHSAVAAALVVAELAGAWYVISERVYGT